MRDEQSKNKVGALAAVRAPIACVVSLAGVTRDRFDFVLRVADSWLALAKSWGQNANDANARDAAPP